MLDGQCWTGTLKGRCGCEQGQVAHHAPWYEWPRAEYSMLCACEYESESQSQSLTHAQPTSDAPNKWN